MSRHVRSFTAAAASLLAATALAAQPPHKSPELVAKGKASYDINCASCHGPKGLGDGIAASALAKKPRNLVADQYVKGAKVGEIFATLGQGLPGTPMVAYGHLPEDERWALAYYVLELRGAKKK